MSFTYSSAVDLMPPYSVGLTPPINIEFVLPSAIQKYVQRAVKYIIKNKQLGKTPFWKKKQLCEKDMLE